MLRIAPASKRALARVLAVSAVFFGTYSYPLFQSKSASPTFCPPQYINNYPKEAEEDWTDDCQGITHDDTHWYINQRRVIFRIPVERDLWQGHKHQPGVSFRHLDDIPELDGYDHMGGSASYKYNGTWYVLVPVDQGPGDALCAVFRADASLAIVGTTTIPGQPDGAGWLAVGPDGFVYTSVSFPNFIRKLSMNWATIESGPSLSFVSLIPLKDENGAPYQLFHMQGGAVTPDNTVLFISNGLGDCFFSGGGTEEDSFGMHAFDLATGQRITRSCQSGCAWRFQFNSCSLGYPDEEPEGITFWDLDSGIAPGISGQLHAILLDNDLGTSDVYLKHYRVGGSVAAGIGCPENIAVECTQTGGTPKGDAQLAEFFDVVALVGCDQGLEVSNDAPDVLPHGTTTVTFTAEDAAGNVAQCSADVTVVDTTPPVIVCPGDAVVECTDPCGTRVGDGQVVALFAGVSATDVCDADVAITNDASECLPFGDTWVQFIATDDDGNADSCRVKVTVEDTTPPDIEVTLDRDVLWPPNHKLAEVCAAEVTVTDLCDNSPTYVLYSIASSEPDNTNGDGNTVDDIQDDDLETADTCFKLRSERMGGGDGRKYMVIYQARDHSNNVAYDTVCVRVPHDQSGKALASAGFSANGKSLTGLTDKVAVIIPASAGLDAAAVDVSHIYLGNTDGVITPAGTRVADANADRRPDLILFFDTMGVTQRLAGPMSGGDEDVVGINGGLWAGAVGVHFVSPAGVDCLIENILGLGAPVPLPALVTEPPSPLDRGMPMVGSTRETALSSINPNPFNPQTTVEFALSSPQHVQIMIYDVRGSLVRRLVDQPLSAGEHRAVWNGVDDAGRPATSGIYLVRMVAGRFTETRKIVLMK